MPNDILLSFSFYNGGLTSLDLHISVHINGNIRRRRTADYYTAAAANKLPEH